MDGARSPAVSAAFCGEEASRDKTLNRSDSQEERMISRRVTQVCGLLPLFVFAAFGQNLSLADREQACISGAGASVIPSGSLESRRILISRKIEEVDCAENYAVFVVRRQRRRGR
jgi:hypothetical protein